MATADGAHEIGTTPIWFSNYFIYLTGLGKDCEIKFVSKKSVGRKVPIVHGDKLCIVVSSRRGSDMREWMEENLLFSAFTGLGYAADDDEGNMYEFEFRLASIVSC